MTASTGRIRSTSQKRARNPALPHTTPTGRRPLSPPSGQSATDETARLLLVRCTEGLAAPECRTDYLQPDHTITNESVAELDELSWLRLTRASNETLRQ